MANVICPYFVVPNQITHDSQGILFSLSLLILVILAITIFTFILISPEKIQINKIIGGIFLGIGAGIFAGTIFAYSVRVQAPMCLIYGIAGLAFLISGSILKNF